MPPSNAVDTEEAVVRAYYERGEERERLSDGRGQREFIRTPKSWAQPRLGPLYHLASRADRTTAIREAARILRPGGAPFAAAISRWATRIDGIIGKQIYLKCPAALDLIDEAERTGVFPPLHAGAFSADRLRPHLLATAILPANA
jgi:hypothetical protein